MLLFGFFVLAVLLCGDVFSGAIGTSDADRKKDVEKYGIFSNYCRKSVHNSYSWSSPAGQLSYPPTPVVCGTGREMRCKNYINPGETKFELRNEDSWPMRECVCERDMYDCLMENSLPSDRHRAKDMLNIETCFKAPGCEGKPTSDCTPKYIASSVKAAL